MIVFTLVVLITASIGVGFMWVNKFISSVYFQKSEVSLMGSVPDIQSAQNYATKAIYFSPSTENLRLYSNIHLIRPLQLINKIGGIVPENQITDEIRFDINKAFQSAQYAAVGKKASFDYQDWIQFGRVSEAATFLGSTSTADVAVKSYAQASILAPNNPTPLFLLGRMFVYAGKKDIAQQYLEKAIELKPDFSEAISILQSIDGKDNIEVKPTLVSSSTPAEVKNKK